MNLHKVNMNSYSIPIVMLQKYVNKVRVQIEDIVSQENLVARVQIVLCVVNRRRIPLPSALYQFFTKPCEGNAADLGNEKFLAEYIVPGSDKCFVDVGARLEIGHFSSPKKAMKFTLLSLALRLIVY